MTIPSRQPRYLHKVKLRNRFKGRLADELALTMDKALLLGELICEQRSKEWTAKVALIPKPPKKSKPMLPRIPRMNDWGLVK